VLFGRRVNIYTIVFAISFIININQQIFLEPIKITPLGEQRAKAYYVDDPESFYSGERYLHSTWYLKYHAMGFTNFGLQLLIFIFLFWRFYQKKMHKLEQYLFSVGILTMSLSNITYFIYALYGRSGIVGGLFVLASIVMFLQRYLTKREANKLSKIQVMAIGVSLVFFIPFFFLKIAQLIIYTSVFAFVLPPIKWFNIVENFSVRQLIGSLVGK